MDTINYLVDILKSQYVAYEIWAYFTLIVIFKFITCQIHSLEPVLLEAAHLRWLTTVL